MKWRVNIISTSFHELQKKITAKKGLIAFRQHILDEFREIQRNHVTNAHPLDKVTVPSNIWFKRKTSKARTYAFE